jgi:hypothetical protein
MAINKAYDRSFFLIGGAVKTSGGALNLAKGQMAVVDLSKPTIDGAAVLSSLAGKPKRAKDIAIRVGISDKEPNRTYSNMAGSTDPFALNEVKNLRVSVPKQTEQTVDEVVIGYDGFDPATAFRFKTGDKYFNLVVELKNGLLQYRGAEGGCEIVHINVEIPDCDPYNTCEDCDNCDTVDCKSITLEAIERLKRKQVAGGMEVQDFIEVTPVFSCDNDATATLIPYDYYTLSVCDTGDDNALALIQAQYDVPVIRTDRVGSTSTYQILLKESLGAPDDYTQGVASLIKDCEDCPAGYSAVAGGFVYAITIEDDGIDRTSVIEAALANAKYATGTMVKSGNNAGVGFYTGVYTSKITDAEIASFIGTATNSRNTATVGLVGAVSAICTNSTVSETEWVVGDTCNAVEERYTIVLPDNKCGDDRLAELQTAYANNTIYAFNSTRAVVLAGAGGTRNININGVNYLATFDTDLATTGANFITDHAADILADTGLVVTFDTATLTFAGPTYYINTIASGTGATLTATVGTVTADFTSVGCQNKYETLVVSNLVCEECDPVFLDFYTTVAPDSYSEIKWVLTAGAPSTPYGNCLCGIRLKGKTFLLQGDEALRDIVGFTETSTQIQVAGGFPDEIREGIGTLQEGTYATKYFSYWTPRTHLAGNLRNLEKEGRAYFLGERYRHDYLGRVLRGETSSMQDLLKQYIQYTIEIGHEGYTQSFAGTNSKNIEYHIFVEVGMHDAVEDILNNIAANAGIEGVQAFGV